MPTEHLLADLSTELTSLIARASVHVVGVSARPRRPASGVALGGDLVLAADHTIERDSGITVTLGNDRYEASVVGRDAATDLALLRASGLAATEPATAPVPDPGTLVISIARTTSGTVSTALGVITSVGGPLRTRHGVVVPALLRTDAALRPGTAGGAIVDPAGRLLGMTTPGLLRGLPVAIPIEQARAIAAQLASGGPIGRGYLGISVQAVRVPERQRHGDAERGLLVSGIAADSAADRAAWLVGDILMRFNDVALTSVDDLQDALAQAAPGSTVSVVLERGGTVHEGSVTIGAHRGRD